MTVCGPPPARATGFAMTLVLRAGLIISLGGTPGSSTVYKEYICFLTIINVILLLGQV